MSSAMGRPSTKRRACSPIRFALTFDDPEHSVDEPRYMTIGTSSKQRIVFLSHADRGEDLQDYTVEHYKSRRRPKNPNSMHCAIWPKDLRRFRDNWSLIKESSAKARPNTA
jgi:hypothetical protein